MVRAFRKMILFFLTLFATGTKAQSSFEIGDTFNMNIISPAANYYKDSLDLSEYKGKMVIIDFWATWCVPCIQEFRKLDSLQNKYKDALQIVLVTNEPQEKITEFFKLSKAAKGVKLPSIVNDRKLNMMFRHKTIPHKIWINDKGLIVAITGNKDFTSDNIDKFIKKEKFSFRAKKDILDYNRRKPYLINNNGGINQAIISSSILARYNEGLSSFIELKKDSLGASNGISAINVDLLKMLVIAYGKFEIRTTVFNRTFLHVKDSSLFFTEKIASGDMATWIEQYGLCYDLTIPSFTKNTDSILNIMQQDLRRSFPYYGKIEKRSIDCWVLCRTSTEDKIKSKGGDEAVSLIPLGAHYLKNVPLSTLVNTLNTFAPRGIPYMVDQTNYQKNVDIDLGDDQLVNQTSININSIQKHLKKYDLALIRKKAEVDVLVIYED